MCNDDGCIDLNDKDNEKYSPTPVYKKIVQAMRTKPKTHDPKMTLNSSYFAFLCPKKFDTIQFSQDHSQVYSEEEMR
jgi:hypothetical protein